MILAPLMNFLHMQINIAYLIETICINGINVVNVRPSIKMTYNVALKKRIVRHDLIEKIGLDRHEYWGFMQLTNAQFEEIIYAGGVSSESIIQNVCSQIVAFENEILYDECRLFRKRWMYMCAILLSINPKYVRRIMCGEKKYEFRKNLCKKKVDKIIIYSTSPVMKVVGEAVVEDVLVDEPFKIWNMTKEAAGVDQSFFDSYYEGKTKAVAYKLNHVVEYKIPKLLQDYGINVAPQSFCYLE